VIDESFYTIAVHLRDGTYRRNLNKYTESAVFTDID